jgi:hypothetical protein
MALTDADTEGSAMEMLAGRGESTATSLDGAFCSCLTTLHKHSNYVAFCSYPHSAL